MLDNLPYSGIWENNLPMQKRQRRDDGAGSKGLAFDPCNCPLTLALALVTFQSPPLGRALWLPFEAQRWGRWQPQVSVCPQLSVGSSLLAGGWAGVGSLRSPQVWSMGHWSWPYLWLPSADARCPWPLVAGRKGGSTWQVTQLIPRETGAEYRIPWRCARVGLWGFPSSII